MAAYYADVPEYCIMVYKFQPQKLYYEMYDRDTFAEVLYPDSIYDLIDYHLKECIRRGVKLRKCKTADGTLWCRVTAARSIATGHSMADAPAGDRCGAGVDDQA